MNQFFVYGTLKRGLRNASVWPSEPVSVCSAWVRGVLYHRADYPAMQIGNDRVRGELWTFPGEQVADVLNQLDLLEGTNGNTPQDLYHRVTIDVFKPLLQDANQQNGSTNSPTREHLLGQAYTYVYVRDPVVYGFARMPRQADGYVAWPATS